MGYVAFVVDAMRGGFWAGVTSTSMTTRWSSMGSSRRSGPGAANGVVDLDGVIHHTDYAEVCVKPRICGDGLCSWGLLADFSA